MIEFNELYITRDSSKLVIDVSIKDLCYFDDMYISEIIIDDKSTYSSLGPSSSPIYKYNAKDFSDFIEGDDVCKYFNGVIPTEEEITEGRRRVRLELPSTKLPLLDNLLFIYVKTKGIPDPNTPCSLDRDTFLGVTYNKYPIFLNGISELNRLSNESGRCKEASSDSFMDFLLKYNAFKLSLDVGDHNKAIKYFNEFYANLKKVKPIKSNRCCG